MGEDEVFKIVPLNERYEFVCQLCWLVSLKQTGCVMGCHE